MRGNAAPMCNVCMYNVICFEEFFYSLIQVERSFTVFHIFKTIAFGYRCLSIVLSSIINLQNFKNTIQLYIISFLYVYMVNTMYLLSFVETPRKFIIAIMNLRGVSTKLNKYNQQY